MSRYDASNIRNVAILGHQGSGKTSLVEALYFVTGATTLKGEVSKKNTVSDYLPDEQRKQMSIQTAVVPVYHNNTKINVIDLPGNDDFIGETLGVTKVIKGAILVIDGTVGVQVGTVKSWNTLRRAGIPVFIEDIAIAFFNIRMENTITADWVCRFNDTRTIVQCTVIITRDCS